MKKRKKIIVVSAIYDYQPNDDQKPDKDRLYFRKSDLIHVLYIPKSSGWWQGIAHGRRGWFPSNFVDFKHPQTLEIEPPDTYFGWVEKIDGSGFYNQLLTISNEETSQDHNTKGINAEYEKREKIQSILESIQSVIYQLQMNMEDGSMEVDNKENIASEPPSLKSLVIRVEKSKSRFCKVNIVSIMELIQCVQRLSEFKEAYSGFSILCDSLQSAINMLLLNASAKKSIFYQSLKLLKDAFEYFELESDTNHENPETSVIFEDGSNTREIFVLLVNLCDIIHQPSFNYNNLLDKLKQTVVVMGNFLSKMDNIPISDSRYVSEAKLVEFNGSKELVYKSISALVNSTTKITCDSFSEASISTERDENAQLISAIRQDIDNLTRSFERLVESFHEIEAQISADKYDKKLNRREKSKGLILSTLDTNSSGASRPISAEENAASTLAATRSRSFNLDNEKHVSHLSKKISVSHSVSTNSGSINFASPISITSSQAATVNAGQNSASFSDDRSNTSDNYGKNRSPERKFHLAISPGLNAKFTPSITSNESQNAPVSAGSNSDTSFFGTFPSASSILRIPGLKRMTSLRKNRSSTNSTNPISPGSANIASADAESALFFGGPSSSVPGSYQSSFPWFKNSRKVSLAASIPSLDDKDENYSSKMGFNKIGEEIMGYVNENDEEESLKAEQEGYVWYLGHDLRPQEILLGSDGNLKGITLPALIERITRHDEFDSDLLQSFLVTYRTFARSEEVFKLIVNRFHLEPPENLTESDLEVWTRKKLKPIRLRIINMLKTWLDSHFYHQEDWDVLSSLENFIREDIKECMPQAAEQLLKLVEKRLRDSRSVSSKISRLSIMSPSSVFADWQSTLEEPPVPVLPKNLKRFRLQDIDPLELARQLTLVDSIMYQQILPIELVNKAWSDKQSLDAPHIKQLITYSNQLTGWIAETIVMEEDIKRRSAVVKYFILVADRLKSMNNFNSLMAVLAALNSSPVHRLKRTFDLLSSKTRVLLEDLKLTMAPGQNFLTYRQMLRSCKPPCVPFLGLYLTDLTFIEDGNPNQIKSMPHLINIDKRIKTASKIREIRQFQQTPFNYIEIPELQDYIDFNLKQSIIDTESLYDQSLYIEPREREDEKIARLLQETGFV